MDQFQWKREPLFALVDHEKEIHFVGSRQACINFLLLRPQFLSQNPTVRMKPLQRELQILLTWGCYFLAVVCLFVSTLIYWS